MEDPWHDQLLEGASPRLTLQDACREQQTVNPASLKQRPDSLDYPVKVVLRLLPGEVVLKPKKLGKLQLDPYEQNGACVGVRLEGRFQDATVYHHFHVSAAIPETSSQQDVFLRVGLPMVEGTVAQGGVNSCCFIFGRPGTGKSFTAIGPRSSLGQAHRTTASSFSTMGMSRSTSSLTSGSGDAGVSVALPAQGLMPRCLDMLFRIFRQEIEDGQVEVHLSSFDVIGEKTRDLLHQCPHCAQMSDTLQPQISPEKSEILPPGKRKEGENMESTSSAFHSSRYHNSDKSQSCCLRSQSPPHSVHPPKLPQHHHRLQNNESLIERSGKRGEPDNRTYKEPLCTVTAGSTPGSGGAQIGRSLCICCGSSAFDLDSEEYPKKNIREDSLTSKISEVQLTSAEHGYSLLARSFDRQKVHDDACGWPPSCAHTVHVIKIVTCCSRLSKRSCQHMKSAQGSLSTSNGRPSAGMRLTDSADSESRSIVSSHPSLPREAPRSVRSKMALPSEQGSSRCLELFQEPQVTYLLFVVLAGNEVPPERPGTKTASKRGSSNEEPAPLKTGCNPKGVSGTLCGTLDSVRELFSCLSCSPHGRRHEDWPDIEKRIRTAMEKSYLTRVLLHRFPEALPARSFLVATIKPDQQASDDMKWCLAYADQCQRTYQHSPPVSIRRRTSAPRSSISSEPSMASSLFTPRGCQNLFPSVKTAANSGPPSSRHSTSLLPSYVLHKQSTSAEQMPHKNSAQPGGKVLFVPVLSLHNMTKCGCSRFPTSGSLPIGNDSRRASPGSTVERAVSRRNTTRSDASVSQRVQTTTSIEPSSSAAPKQEDKRHETCRRILEEQTLLQQDVPAMPESRGPSSDAMTLPAGEAGDVCTQPDGFDLQFRHALGGKHGRLTTPQAVPAPQGFEHGNTEQIHTVSSGTCAQTDKPKEQPTLSSTDRQIDILTDKSEDRTRDLPSQQGQPINQPAHKRIQVEEESNRFVREILSPLHLTFQEKETLTPTAKEAGMAIFSLPSYAREEHQGLVNGWAAQVAAVLKSQEEYAAESVRQKRRLALDVEQKGEKLEELLGKLREDKETLLSKLQRDAAELRSIERRLEEEVRCAERDTETKLRQIEKDVADERARIKCAYDSAIQEQKHTLEQLPSCVPEISTDARFAVEKQERRKLQSLISKRNRQLQELKQCHEQRLNAINLQFSHAKAHLTSEIHYTTAEFEKRRSEQREVLRRCSMYGRRLYRLSRHLRSMVSDLRSGVWPNRYKSGIKPVPALSECFSILSQPKISSASPCPTVVNSALPFHLKSNSFERLGCERGVTPCSIFDWDAASSYPKKNDALLENSTCLQRHCTLLALPGQSYRPSSCSLSPFSKSPYMRPTTASYITIPVAGRKVISASSPSTARSAVQKRQQETEDTTAVDQSCLSEPQTPPQHSQDGRWCTIERSTETQDEYGRKGNDETAADAKRDLEVTPNAVLPTEKTEHIATSHNSSSKRQCSTGAIGSFRKPKKPLWAKSRLRKSPPSLVDDLKKLVSFFDDIHRRALSYLAHIHQLRGEDGQKKTEVPYQTAAAHTSRVKSNNPFSATLSDKTAALNTLAMPPSKSFSDSLTASFDRGRQAHCKGGSCQQAEVSSQLSLAFAGASSKKKDTLLSPKCQANAGWKKCAVQTSEVDYSRSHLWVQSLCDSDSSDFSDSSDCLDTSSPEDASSVHKDGSSATFSESLKRTFDIKESSDHKLPAAVVDTGPRTYGEENSFLQSPQGGRSIEGGSTSNAAVKSQRKKTTASQGRAEDGKEELNLSAEGRYDKHCSSRSLHGIHEEATLTGSVPFGRRPTFGFCRVENDISEFLNTFLAFREDRAAESALQTLDVASLKKACKFLNSLSPGFSLSSSLAKTCQDPAHDT